MDVKTVQKLFRAIDTRKVKSNKMRNTRHRKHRERKRKKKELRKSCVCVWVGVCGCGCVCVWVWVGVQMFDIKVFVRVIRCRKKRKLLY